MSFEKWIKLDGRNDVHLLNTAAEVIPNIVLILALSTSLSHEEESDYPDVPSEKPPSRAQPVKYHRYSLRRPPLPTIFGKNKGGLLKCQVFL